MIIISVKAPAPPPPPPAECLCNVAWSIRSQVTTPEYQRVVDYPKYQVTTPENQTTSDIRLVLEYTIS